MRSERDQKHFVAKLLIILLVCIFYYCNITIKHNRGHRYKAMQKVLTFKRYLVWSENCHMPSMDPFQSIYMSDYEPRTPPNCSTRDPLVVKLFNRKTKQYILHIEKNLTNGDQINCCYQQILRKSEKKYEKLDCERFEQDFKVPNEIDYMLITCRDINQTIVYQDGLSFIQDRGSVNEKLDNNYTAKNSHRPFGILLFGVDSLSQFNFRRVMPKTFQYVQNHSWLELSGYNKIDDNTFPNLMAVFTGYSLKKSSEMCKLKEPNGLDNCSTLFKFCNQQNLATAYSEDESVMNTFSYRRPGFQLPPTDYYQRPLLMAMEKNLPIQKLSNLNYCLGPRRAAEYVYNFGIEFADRFLGQSIFGLFWTNSFSHNYWRDPNTMDDRMVKYFKEMDTRGIFENNAVVFFSDHGSRFGFLRSKKDGYIEERLPMFFLRLPQWFKQKYSNYAHAFKANKNRLTSPYDFHMTLKHLTLLSQGKESMYDTLENPLSCETCHTLFKLVAENRTCKQAGISDHWCTCTPFQTMKTNSAEMQRFAMLVISEMNAYLRKHGFNTKCAPLMLKDNIEANLKLKFHENSHMSQIQTYRINFKTLPNNAQFDATFAYNTFSNNITIDVTEISRLNIYANDSKCIDNNIMKKFCICHESIKGNK